MTSIKQGTLSLPGADAASKAIVEELLEKDYREHHCYSSPGGFHNHLSHHVLAVYDLGATSTLIQAIYDKHAKFQRPIDLNENGIVPESVIKPGEIKKENWTQYLGEPRAYSAYVTFFSNQIAAQGTAQTMEDYIFSSTANGNGACMLFRLVSGAFHPLIQLGGGLEFGLQSVVASGLAQTAIHLPREQVFLSPEDFVNASSPNLPSASLKGRQPYRGPSILSMFRQIYDSDKLIPVLPYDPNAMYSKRLRDIMELDGGVRIAELKRIMSHFDPGETSEELDGRAEELIFATTLLTFGTGKKGRKPRMDFFLMHILTSTFFIPTFLKHVSNVESKKMLLRALLQVWGLVVMARGRPRIDAALLMSYTKHPIPPNMSTSEAHSSSIDGKNAESQNHWLAIIADAIHAPDSHTIKSLRTLLYGAVKYGTISKGHIIGAFDSDGRETHPGIGEADGTIFVRAAGVLMESLGWVTHGQEAKGFDTSALGWDGAWENDD